MTEPCSPYPDPDIPGAFVCDAPDRQVWELRAESEFPSAGTPNVREMVAALQGVLQAHDLDHEQPRPRPTRNARPKFKSGLGMAPGVRITEAGASTSPG